MKTYLPKVQEVKRQWHEIDASRFTLGRLASRVAGILRGKHKAVFTPHMDLGDFVVVINARRIKLTGRKLEQKQYRRYSGYPGGIKQQSLRELLEKNPKQVIFHATSHMLARNRLKKSMLKRLKVVAEAKHNYKIDKQIEK